jgi:hypothetical protein
MTLVFSEVAQAQFALVGCAIAGWLGRGRPPLYREGLNTRRVHGRTPGSLWPSAIHGDRRSTAKGWSIYGAKRAQPLGTGGKWDTPKNRSNRPTRNRWQPTATGSQRMVRRGSTVRVRQEGSAKAQHVAAFAFSSPTCTVGSVRWIWSRLWSFRVQNGVARKHPTAFVPARAGAWGCWMRVKSYGRVRQGTPRNTTRTRVRFRCAAALESPDRGQQSRRR